VAEPVMEPERDEEPALLANLDLRAIRAYVDEADGDLVLLVDDGDVQVEFDSGLSGSWEQAILGAERIATAALEYASELRRRGVG
jgi:hypothetical protein